MVNQKALNSHSVSGDNNEESEKTPSRVEVGVLWLFCERFIADFALLGPRRNILFNSQLRRYCCRDRAFLLSYRSPYFNVIYGWFTVSCCVQDALHFVTYTIVVIRNAIPTSSLPRQSRLPMTKLHMRRTFKMFRKSPHLSYNEKLQ